MSTHADMVADLARVNTDIITFTQERYAAVRVLKEANKKIFTKKKERQCLHGKMGLPVEPIFLAPHQKVEKKKAMREMAQLMKKRTMAMCHGAKMVKEEENTQIKLESEDLKMIAGADGDEEKWEDKDMGFTRSLKRSWSEDSSGIDDQEGYAERESFEESTKRLKMEIEEDGPCFEDEIDMEHEVTNPRAGDGGVWIKPEGGDWINIMAEDGTNSKFEQEDHTGIAIKREHGTGVKQEDDEGVYTESDADLSLAGLSLYDNEEEKNFWF